VKVIRTISWVVLAAIWLAFLVLNWGQPVQVIIWPLEATYLQFVWPVSVIALVFFLIGLVPMWLFYRAARWRWQRRIASLENSLRATALQPPIATSTQLDALSAEAQSESTAP
jgi:lipopolysaccharide assembly protein A